jgi:hypothetical protein
MARPIVTIVIHGTYARDEAWWRLDPDHGSFASRLEAALAARGLPGTVWRPALDAGLDYDAFTWSGRNSHPDRRRGARRLAATLERLGAAIGATAERPLQVNFVAHSHGGNVVLDALGRLGRSVRARRVLLLGTPLITARPALRLFRTLIAFVLLGLVSYGILEIALALLAPDLIELPSLVFIGLVVLFVMFYGWVLLGFAALVDAMFRLISWPLAWAMDRGSGQVYGPSPHRMALSVVSGRIALFTTYDDEADVALQLSAAPRRLYAELVRRRLHPVLRVAEVIAIRPLVYGIVLGAIEAALERFALGFPWLYVLFMNSEMADLTRGRAYPPALIQRIDVSKQLLPAIQAAQAAHPPEERLPLAPPGTAILEDRRTRSLYQKLEVVARNLKAQIRLRHGVYYENNEVIELVAQMLVDETALEGPS